MIRASLQLVRGTVLVAALALGVPASAKTAASEGPFATSTWLAPQMDLDEPYPGMDLSIGVKELDDQTLRQSFRISAGGGGLRLRFSNEFGTSPLTIDSVTLARSLGLGAVDAASILPVTFGGKRSMTIAQGAEALSDAINVEARALSEWAVSMHFRHATVRTGHRFSRTTTWIGAGDMTASAIMPEGKKIQASLFMPEVIALRRARTKVIVAFGDSITDNSPVPNAHQSWPDHLAGFVNAGHPDVSVVNAGIGGNRWVKGNMGPCGLCRFERDVLRIDGVSHVVLALGINDIGNGYRYSHGFKDASQTVSAQQIIAEIRRAIGMAKAKGIKVYAATLVPFKTGFTDYYTTGQPDQVPYGGTSPHNGEQIRGEINTFIRQNREIDGVIDIDRALADPADPLSQRKDYTLEGLHPNAAGETLFARLVYEAIFAAPQPGD